VAANPDLVAKPSRRAGTGGDDEAAKAAARAYLPERGRCRLAF
jgi:hypothetical protein